MSNGFLFIFFSTELAKGKSKEMHAKYIFFSICYNYWLAAILKLVVLNLPFLCFMHGNSIFVRMKEYTTWEGDGQSELKSMAL